MNYYQNIINTILLSATIIFPSAYSFAQETPSKDQQQVDKNDRDGYSLSIALGYANIESPLYDEEKMDGWKLFIDGRYQWKGLFIELANDPARDKNLPAAGYNFYTTEHWNLDFIVAAVTPGTEFNYEIGGETKKISRGSTRGTGIRAQGSWGNSILQLVALPYFHEDLPSDSAVDYASLWLGHRWQIRNWSLNGLVGAVYKSSGLIDYQFGVPASEADGTLWSYEPSSGIDYTAYIDLSYPISKNILFQIYSRHTQYSDQTLDSPLIELARRWENRPEKEQEFGILLNYVF
ncbi:MAG TPA: MipA/OmpV family protein [Cellvibrio sp.]|nr:MipA/OmpV family protein [Cellvibrio sp.]